jgi:membrane protease YdiL (CAAX protease family)
VEDEGQLETVQPPINQRAKEVWGPWASVGFGLLIGVSYLLVQGILLAILTLTGFSGEAGLLFSLLGILGSPVLIGMPLVIATARKGLPLVEYLGLKKPRVGQTFLWIGLLVVANVVFGFAIEWFGDPEAQDFLILISEEPGPLLLLVPSLAILVPLGEEILFRGFLFAGLMRSRMGGYGAVAITATTWAFLHGQYDILGIIQILMIGVILGFARLRTGSLWVPIILHGLLNLVSVVLLVAT